jgi:hypothetical protein
MKLSQANARYDKVGENETPIRAVEHQVRKEPKDPDKLKHTRKRDESRAIH